MLHIDKLKQINKIVESMDYYKIESMDYYKIVESKDYYKLLNYKEYHLEKLLKVLRNCKDIKIQKHILNNAVDLEISSTYIPRQRPIHAVCSNDYGLEMLKILIENKVNLESEDDYKERPIHSVCTNENGVEMLLLLIENKVDLECDTILKSRPIHFVCRNHNGLEMLKILIENKVDLECEDYHKLRPIHSVCTNENGVEMLILLIENKVGLDCDTIFKSRPIHIVCCSNNLEMLKILIENKVDIDPKIRTKNNKNWIDYLGQDNRIKLIEENIISVRQCGYIIKYLQEEQTVEMCQNAIDHDPDNIQYVREDLLVFFR